MAAQFATQSKASCITAQGYLSNTVILAMVLFFAGTASKFDQRRVRWRSLGFVSILVLYSVVMILVIHFA